MLTRSSMRARVKDNQCLGAKDCPFYQVENGLCSKCGHTSSWRKRLARTASAMQAAMDNHRVYAVSHASADTFVDRMRDVFHQVRGTFFKAMIILVGTHRDYYADGLLPAAAIDRLITMGKATLHLHPGPRTTVFEAICLSLCLRPMDCLEARDSVAVCYHGVTELLESPWTESAWRQVMVQHKYIHDLQVPGGRSIFSAYGET